MIDKFLLVAGFGIFILLQAIFINGVHDFFKGYMDSGKAHGNFGYLLFHKFIEKHDKQVWAKPLWSCIKCQSSVWGALSFWPIVIYFFGFHWIEIFIFVYDVFILTSLNYWWYKQI